MTVVFTFESKVSSAFHKKTPDTKHGARNQTLHRWRKRQLALIEIAMGGAWRPPETAGRSR